MKKIFWGLFSTVPTALMIFSLIFFQFNQSFKSYVIEYFDSFRMLSFNEVLLIILIGTVMILVNAPFLIFEMCLGYTFQYQVALSLAIVTKFIAEILCFYLSKYLIRKFLEEHFSSNETFQILLYTSKKYPWELSNLIRANAILPSFIINFGSGLLEINFI